MEKTIKYITCLIAALLLCSCNNKLSQEQYVQALSGEKGRLTVSNTFNGIKFNCQLQTPELMALINNGKAYTDEANFKADKHNFEKQLNFVIIISDVKQPGNETVKNAVSSKEAYSDFLGYANANLQNDFELQLSNGDRVPCSIVHVESANSVNPVIRISGSFKTGYSPSEDYTVIFNDNLFNTGKIKFNYSKDLLANLPEIKL